MAGESAREVARRRRESERLARRFERWERGAEVEERTAEALAALPPGWVVLHEVAWPGRRYANIDHVVVGPGGVFVIETKNWNAEVSLGNGALWRSGRPQPWALEGVRHATSAIDAAVRGVRPMVIHPVLCFIQDCPLEGVCAGVLVCTQANVVSLLTRRRKVLKNRQVLAMAQLLGWRPPMAARSRKWWVPVLGRPARKAGRRVNSRRRSLTRFVVAGVAAVVLLTRPGLVTGAAEALRAWFVEQVVATGSDRSRSMMMIPDNPGPRAAALEPVKLPPCPSHVGETPCC